MKKTSLLNQPLSSVIASMGHTDYLVVCDAGLPIPKDAIRIDLALKENYPAFLEVLKLILTELKVEKIILAEETKKVSPKRFKEILKLFPKTEVEIVPHSEFKKIATQAKAYVRTGEFVPYSNIILVSGVVY